MFQRIVFTIFRRVRSRPHQTHLTLHHIPELRQFIQTVFTEKFSHSSQSRVPGNLEEGPLSLIQMDKLMLEGLGIRVHGAVLVAPEGPSLLPNAKGGIDHRPLRVELDGDRNQH